MEVSKEKILLFQGLSMLVFEAQKILRLLEI